LILQAYTLHLDPQSSRALAPNQKDGITQVVRLQGCARGAGTTVKMRWRASMTLGATNAHKEAMGSIEGLGIP
jgi:hypothetical protein